MDSILSRAAWTVFAVFCLAALSPTFGDEPRVKELRYPDGTVKERYTYVLGESGQELRQGLNEEWYPGGGRKGVRNWKNGQTEGAVIYYHPNGRKSYEANYTNGKKSGYATVWYMSGQKQWQTTFRNGKTNGRWREWYLDGKKKFEANYSDGVLDGLAIWWHDNGRTWQERTYHSGAPVKGSVKEWDKAGRQTFPPLDGVYGGAVSKQDTPPPVAPPSTAAKIEAPREGAERR